MEVGQHGALGSLVQAMIAQGQELAQIQHPMSWEPIVLVQILRHKHVHHLGPVGGHGLLAQDRVVMDMRGETENALEALAQEVQRSFNTVISQLAHPTLKVNHILLLHYIIKFTFLCLSHCRFCFQSL